MTRTKRFLSAMALASFLLGVGSVSAAEPIAPPPSDHAPMGDDLPHGEWHDMGHGGLGFGMSMRGMLPLHELNLSSAQQDKVFQLMHDAEPALYQKMKALRATRESLASAAGFSAYDPAQVRKLAEQQGRQMADLITFRSELRHKLYGLLTPEQQQRLKQHEQWRAHRQG
ncbi:Spy/CpxP family protein refolding chaperone [Crenobacter sp. SG2305]|uniref:Spy/CpxP family protein refolding chaperone n=1 Tax=Crenobacter oryzisoli TaxID=3056844 RepID=UPI0025AA81C1|nr:Spy/CpxP family protein refolding chaperone [Crenobacter sp. SG2305]MDN0085099.1 Spy/CpxP family protein refolding chaperone [Crenobacter sp. SG2305]